MRRNTATMIVLDVVVIGILEAVASLYANVLATYIHLSEALVIVLYTSCLVLILTTGIWSAIRRGANSPTDPLSTPIPLSKLLPKTLNMGGDRAATFPFVVDFIRSQYDQTCQRLLEASQGQGNNSGIVILGQPNAGKTRLAYEALRTTVGKRPTDRKKEWQVIRWSVETSEERLPSLELLAGKQIILFLDDLQRYVTTITYTGSAQSSHLTQIALPTDLKAAALEKLWTTILQGVGPQGRAILVMTCRSGDLQSTEAALTRLLEQVEPITLPPIPDAQKDAVYAALRQAQPNAQLDEAAWDNNIGTALLGVTRKRDEYYRLVSQGQPAASVLRAMKLLALAGTIDEQTEQRIKALAIQVEGEIALRRERVWRHAVQSLETREYLRQDGERLIIHKDVFFERIVDDYLVPALDGTNMLLTTELKRAQHVFVSSHDGIALLNLMRVWEELKEYQQLIYTGEQALKCGISGKDAADAYTMRGVALYYIERYEESLAEFDQALMLDPFQIEAFTYKSMALMDLDRPNDSFKLLTQYASNLEQTFGAPLSSLYDQGLKFAAMKQYEEALVAFAQAIALGQAMMERTLEHHQTDAQILVKIRLAEIWTSKGILQAQLKRPEEALAAFDQATGMNPTNAIAWYNKGQMLSQLGRYVESQNAYEEAFDWNPSDVAALLNNAEVLIGQLDEYEYAVDVCDKALALDRASVRGWRLKGDALHGLLRDEEAQIAYREALVHPAGDLLSLYNRGRAFTALEKYNEAVEAYRQALAFEKNDADLWRGLAIALQALGRNDETLKANEKVEEFLGRRSF